MHTTTTGATRSFAGRLLVVASLLLLIIFSNAVPGVAQDPTPPDPFGQPGDPGIGDGDDPDPYDIALLNPHLARVPQPELTITLSKPYRDETEFTGMVVQIDNRPRPDAAVKRVPFEDDINFETRTYDMAKLKELLGTPPEKKGTLPPTSPIQLRDGSGRMVPFNVADIASVSYPCTWLDILEDLIKVAKEQNAAVQLATLEEFRDRNSSSIAQDFSDRLRNEFNTRLLNWFWYMHGIEPTNLDVYLSLGEFMSERGQFDDELELYLEAQTRNVEDVDGRLALRLAHVYLDVLRLPERAIDACDRVEVLRDENGIMVHSPESMELLLLKGRALLLTGRYSEAQGHMTSVLGMIARARDNDAMASIISANRTLDDLEYEARWMRGRAWLKDGRLYLARRDLAAVPSASGFFAEAELDLAATHFFEKNYSGVREILKPGNSALPSLSPAISNARREEDPAKLLLEMTSDDERKAYDPFGPGQPEVPFDPAASKALVLLANGILADELDKELNSLQKQRLAQARDNSVLRPLYVREILPKTKDDVGRYALRALRHDPTSDEPYLVLAEHFQRQGDKGNPGPLVLRPYAEMWLQRAEQVNPNNPMLWYRRGFYAARDRNFVAAIPHLKRAIELAPDFVDAYVMLGELYYRFVEDLRNNPPSDLPADEVERRREFLLRTAMAYFTNALGIDGDRLDVMLKLGHCYLERVQNSRILADALEDELGINRENLQVRGKLEQLFNSITGDLNKAEELFNITRFAQPRVLDVVRQTVDNVPEVIVAVGSEAAVVDKMTFRVLKSGSTLTLTVTGDPGAYTCICKPLNWDSDRSVQEQMLYLQPGDRVGEPDLPGSNIEGGRYTIYPEQTVVARAGLGYVYYVKDYVAGARLRLRGEEYQPTPDLQKASEELLWVLQYVKGHGKQQFSTHPAYLYAWDRYFELHRQNRREQWIDTFERSIRSDENGRTSVGQGWKANYFRDEAISFRMGDKDKLLTMHTAQKANGTLTSITRGEDYQRFSALQADLVVDPELMRPRRLMDGCSAGLVVWEMAGPAGQLDDTWKSIAMLVISIDADGRVTWQECQGVTGDKNRPSPLGPPQVLTLSGPGKDVKRRVRTLRLERRYEFGRGNDGGRKFSWHLVVDDRMEAAIPLPENHPLNDASTGDGKSFQVGVFLKAAVGESNCEIAWDAIRVITEKNKDWIKEVTGLRRDLGGNR